VILSTVLNAFTIMSRNHVTEVCGLSVVYASIDQGARFVLRMKSYNHTGIDICSSSLCMCQL
jgi:hypothetical protein